jgi:hypothetical protein
MESPSDFNKWKKRIDEKLTYSHYLANDIHDRLSKQEQRLKARLS